MQNKLMKYDPVTGKPTPYPSQATQYRKYHGVIAWLYNPWTGDKRDPQDIGSDIQGVGIDTGEEEIARLYNRLYSYPFTRVEKRLLDFLASQPNKTIANTTEAQELITAEILDTIRDWEEEHKV